MEPVRVLSRSTLLGLKAQADEETRIRNVKSYVENICHQVMNIARTSTQTRFQLEVGNHYPYIRDNMPDILEKLQTLFPDSKVDTKFLYRGLDKKMYDIADIDERMKPFIDIRLKQEYIVIDWSL